MEERIRRRRTENINSIFAFANFIQDTAFVDFPMVRDCFTWHRRRAEATFSRLDRILIANEWLNCYSDIFQKCLSSSLSDHHLVVLGDNWKKAVAETSRGLAVWRGLRNLLLVIQDWHKNKFREMAQKIKTLEGELHKMDVE
ncbi:Uncharacterized protein TCM_013962 [Theobroma cacao]|uniref:Uncharacterized protein n=1 Tax=Theobroma cacao TaxID=3641 RepID=A0A061FXP2_THECC|nr:Uncharacterized protein TCM_013962 [Theobroma cacao]